MPSRRSGRRCARADQAGRVDRMPIQIAFLKIDAPGMQRQIELAKGKPGVEDRLANLQALTLARAGRLEGARESARHAIELASAAGNRERAAAYETAMAVWEAWYGNTAAAKRSATHVLDAEIRDATSRTPRHWPWRSPATPPGRRRSPTISTSRFPEDTSVRFSYLPTLRALAALRANDPSRAIELLRPAATYEFAQPGISFYGAAGWRSARCIRPTFAAWRISRYASLRRRPRNSRRFSITRASCSRIRWARRAAATRESLDDGR